MNDRINNSPESVKYEGSIDKPERLEVAWVLEGNGVEKSPQSRSIKIAESDVAQINNCMKQPLGILFYVCPHDCSINGESQESQVFFMIFGSKVALAQHHDKWPARL